MEDGAGGTRGVYGTAAGAEVASDEWAVQGRYNVWGTVPDVSQMQPEGGAAGAVHGALYKSGQWRRLH